MNEEIQSVDNHLWALGFPKWHEVTGRHSIADLHKPRQRCGIYVLGFANGDRYVGQAVDVVRRFAQHRQVHGDITHMTFQRRESTELNEVEQRCIHTLEAQGMRLRNLAHMSVVQGERDFDLVVTPDEQAQWLRGDIQGLRDAEQHVQDEALRRRYRPRFEQFMTQPHAQDALLLLGVYLLTVVPFPRRTELGFWMVSCLPEGVSAERTLYCRVSLNMQEVFSLFADQDGLWGSFHLARSPFESEFGEQWSHKLQELSWEHSDHRYRPGGHDQFNLMAYSFDDILTLLSGKESSEAMCLLNLRLMRKGATYYSQYHCLDLVDAAMQAFDLRQHELSLSAAGDLMTLNPVSGIFHIEGRAYPARFDPTTWMVTSSYDPEDKSLVTDSSKEYPVRFESAGANGGSITGFARCISNDGEGKYQIYLK